MSGVGWDDDTEDDYDAEQQGGELAALDFSGFSPHQDDESRETPSAGPSQDDESEVPVFTVTNPEGTVSVSAYLTGPVQRVDLDPSVVKMTERELAEEIRVIAELAQLKARSVMHGFLLEGLARMGNDRAEWSSILSTAIQLPSPEQAAENLAEVFAARYGEDAH